MIPEPAPGGAPTARGPYNILALAQAQVPCGQDYQQIRARLDLYTESVVLTRFRHGKPVTAYEVDAGDLAATFSGLTFSSGLLPPDCLAYSRVGGEELLLVYRPPQPTRLTAKPGKGAPRQYTVPLPGLVFRGRGTYYSVHAVRERPTTLAAALYHAPVPNVYEDGRICQGTCAFPVAQGDTIQAALGVFLSSVFNRDLAAGKSARQRQDVTQLWAELDQTTDFPLDDLCPARRKLADLVGQP
ncbi:MAG: prokaryotic E2 ligase family D protein [Chloroflexi bacterium]|nr:prokaryotic E2 ligase family D protein [Chloroflexota bacterium]MBU1749102.1 prokaryotic E2 ligase family D protein [Chloroflexota bacterium]MBU1877839.1 prokaryotic E2 ligase family D protein [Chloroflexota bacterium]